MEFSKEALMTEEQRKEMAMNKDVIHAQHGLTIKTMFEWYQDHVLISVNRIDRYNDLLTKAKNALSYYDELLPSKGFWGRVCSRQSTRIKELEKEVEELKGYKWKYEDLCK